MEDQPIKKDLDVENPCVAPGRDMPPPERGASCRDPIRYTGLTNYYRTQVPHVVTLTPSKLRHHPCLTSWHKKPMSRPQLWPHPVAPPRGPMSWHTHDITCIMKGSSTPTPWAPIWGSITILLMRGSSISKKGSFPPPHGPHICNQFQSPWWKRVLDLDQKRILHPRPMGPIITKNSKPML